MHLFIETAAIKSDRKQPSICIYIKSWRYVSLSSAGRIPNAWSSSRKKVSRCMNCSTFVVNWNRRTVGSTLVNSNLAKMEPKVDKIG